MKPVFHCILLCFGTKGTCCNIELTRFLSTVFLCSEFKLENIFSGVNFCGKNVRGNFYLRELIFADGWKNCKN